MRFSALLVSLFVFPLAACQQPTSYRPPLTQEEVRAEEANQQRLVDEVKAQGGQKKAWQNRPNMSKQFGRVASRIEDAGAAVCRELDIPKENRSCYYYFQMSRDQDLNAHADGKSIVMNTGLMRFLNSDDEVAVVLGHELAHNLMGHPDATRNNAIVGGLIGLAADAVVASQGVNTQGGFTKAGAQAGVLTYSVPFEEEADYIGLYIAARAGYNISLAPNLWRRMSIEFPDGIYNGGGHPSNAARFVSLQKTVSEINYKRKHRVPLLPDFNKDVTS